MAAETIAELQAESLVSAEPVATYENRTEYAALATASGHKVHYVRVALWRESGNVTIATPYCGAQRYNTIRNRQLVPLAHGISCGSCIRVLPPTFVAELAKAVK